MKTKVFIFLAIAAAITLSFTFATGKKEASVTKEVTAQQSSNEPAGGFVSEGKF